jgi:hypothetical protein
MIHRERYEVREEEREIYMQEMGREIETSSQEGCSISRQS